MKGPNRSKLRQWWVIAFVLGTAMINYPFLHIFNRPSTVLGFPLLFLYFTIGWGASIAVIGFYSWLLRRLPPEETP